MNYEVDEFIYILGLIISVYGKIFAKQSIRKIFVKPTATSYCWSKLLYVIQDELEHWTY